MQKSKRKLTALHTLEILQKGGYTNTQDVWIDLTIRQYNTVEYTHLYTPIALQALIKTQQTKETGFETVFEVNGLTTLDSVRFESRHDSNVVALNFASAKNPGGGFLGGASAQEESIARASGLYPSLQKEFDGYYAINRATKTCLYTDNIIYSPTVPIFKLEDGTLMNQPVYASIITAPAVNAGVVRRNEKKNIKHILPRMRQRMDMVLAICQAHKHETLILGAWGCGVFQNVPMEVAQLFKELLSGKYKNQFKRVVFSIYARNPRFITPFQEVFGA